MGNKVMKFSLAFSNYDKMVHCIFILFECNEKQLLNFVQNFKFFLDFTIMTLLSKDYFLIKKKIITPSSSFSLIEL